jgi:hypothetical protein
MKIPVALESVTIPDIDVRNWHNPGGRHRKIIINTIIAIFKRMPRDLPGRGFRATQAPDGANPLHLLPRPGTSRRLSVRFSN